MNNIIANPNITLETVKLIKQRVNSNTETIDDYKAIDLCLSIFLDNGDEHFLLTQLKKLPQDNYSFIVCLCNYENLEKFRKNYDVKDDFYLLKGLVKGTITGLLGFIEDRIN